MREIIYYEMDTTSKLCEIEVPSPQKPRLTAVYLTSGLRTLLVI